MNDNSSEMTWMEELNLIEDVTNRIKKKVQKEISEIKTNAAKSNNLLAGRNQFVWDTAYQRGLDDAWKAAKTIADLSTNPKKRREMIGDYAPAYFVRTKTASEAIEAIRQWEQKQDEIRVGDEATFNDQTYRFVVLQVESDGGVEAIDYLGNTYSTQLPEIKKTGRHFPQVEELLKQMQEGK